MATRWSYEAAIERSDLKPMTRLVLATIARNADARTGMIPARFMPSAASLAARTGLSERRVRDHLKLAEQGGWLVVEQRPGRKSALALTIPNSPESLGEFSTTPDVLSGVTPDVSSDGSDPLAQPVFPRASGARGNTHGQVLANSPLRNAHERRAA